jgi:hypothetical protein
MAITLETTDVSLDILEIEAVLDDVETSRLDLPVDATAERITLRQTQKNSKPVW